ncbi:MAG: CPBP family intramembrane glutamic endopeptidase [Flavobacteriaceae bacterium]|nr:CPBP family intramembrane glutamic endopeptidase [Flavobacteriaceae bacterium]
MDFIAQANPFKRSIWTYIGGFLVTFVLAQIVGSIPILGYMAYYTAKGKTITDPFELSGLIGSNPFLALILITFVVSMIALIFWVRKLHEQPLLNLITARKKIDWRRIRFAFLLWGIVIVALTLLDYYDNPQDYLINFKPLPFFGLLLIAVVFIPIQTSFEELLFRGYLMQGVGLVSGKRWVALLVTSLIFGLMHLGNPEIAKLGYSAILIYIAMGFFFGIITLMDEGTELALGFHAVNNLVTALLVTANWTAFQTESIFIDISEPDLSYQYLSLIPLVVITFIFTKKYHWTHWREKLLGDVVITEPPSHQPVSPENPAPSENA